MQALEFRAGFVTNDFEKAMDFYRDTLRMTEISSWDRPDGKGALLDTGSGGVIEIIAHAANLPAEPASGVLFALRVANADVVDDLFRQLSEKGVTVVEEPTVRIWNHYSFVVRDPDGIKVHIFCDTN